MLLNAYLWKDESGGPVYAQFAQAAQQDRRGAAKLCVALDLFHASDTSHEDLVANDQGRGVEIYHVPARDPLSSIPVFSALVRVDHRQRTIETVQVKAVVLSVSYGADTQADAKRLL